MLAPVLVTPASDDAVSLEEAKLRLRVDVDDDDELIEALIATATRKLERELGLALVTQEWRIDACKFTDRIRLRPGPVDASSIVVDYRDEADAEQTLADTVYRVHTDAYGTYVSRASGQTWPASYDREDAVSISFSAGVPVDEVPADLKTAILLHVGHLYENREAVNVGSSVSTLPLGYDDIIWSYRRPKV